MCCGWWWWMTSHRYFSSSFGNSSASPAGRRARRAMPAHVRGGKCADTNRLGSGREICKYDWAVEGSTVLLHILSRLSRLSRLSWLSRLCMLYYALCFMLYALFYLCACFDLYVKIRCISSRCIYVYICVCVYFNVFHHTKWFPVSQRLAPGTLLKTLGLLSQRFPWSSCVLISYKSEKTLICCSGSSGCCWLVSSMLSKWPWKCYYARERSRGGFGCWGWLGPAKEMCWWSGAAGIPQYECEWMLYYIWFDLIWLISVVPITGCTVLILIYKSNSSV